MDKKYPQWLFTILQNDYDDDYWYDINTSDAAFKEAYLKLRTLKRKYSDFNKWTAACAVYDDYIGVIIDHNGGDYAVASMFKAELVPDGWVPRPKLKNKKSNKEIVSSGITPSKIAYTAETISHINEIANKEAPLTDAVRASIPNVTRKPKGEIRAAIYKALSISEEKERVNRMHKNRENFDVLSLYYQESKEKEMDSDVSIASSFDDAVTQLYLDEHDDGWMPAVEEHSNYGLRGNTIYSSADTRRINIEKEIFENNNLVMFDTSKMSRDKVTLYRSEFGMNFDPKKRKKAEKELKKYREDRKKKEKSSLDLIKALTRNQDGEIDITKEKFTLNDFRSKYTK